MTTTLTNPGNWRERIDAIIRGEGDCGDVLCELLLLFNAIAASDPMLTPDGWQDVAVKFAVGVDLIREAGAELPPDGVRWLQWLADQADFAARMEITAPTTSTHPAGSGTICPHDVNETSTGMR